MAAEEPPEKKARAGLPAVLGSSSTWRRALFEKHFPEYGTDFMAADIDEKAIRAERPEDMTLAIARAKADALLPRLAGRKALLICMDQVIVCDGAVREKPEGEAEARAFLESYRQGKGASCVNGMVVHNTETGRRVSAVDIATVHWRPFPDSVVDHLLRKGDIFTCAGGFTVEDPQLKPFLERVQGTLDAVEGLPVKPLRALLQRAVLPSVTHVLFDMDGLLLDTESAYTVAQQELVKRWDKTFTWDVKAKMMGKKALDAAQVLIDELGLAGKITPEAFVKERDERLHELFAGADLMPGAERLVRHLHRHGVPMAVATSSRRSSFELKTSKHRGLFGLMRHVVTGDQVAESKPNPEIFNKAASLFDGGAPPAERVLVFEDAPSGVEAGRSAGMQVCHVPDSNLGLELRGRAHCELRSLEDFRPEEWGLPAFP